MILLNKMSTIVTLTGFFRIRPVQIARMIPCVCLLGLGLSVAGCAPGRNLPLLPDRAGADTAYKLGSGDSIRVITFGEDQLTGEFRVSDSGTVSLPLLGQVPVAGESNDQVSHDTEVRLEKAKIFKQPSVSVEVTSYRPIFILGEVNKPGEYPFQPGMTLLSAVSVGGGFTYRAVDQYASIVRHVNGQVVEGKVDRQAELLPGDVVTVFERRF